MLRVSAAYFILRASNAQLDHLQILQFFPVNGEAQGCSNFVPAVPACGAGVHVEHVQRRVEFHHADVRVPTNEKVRGIALQFIPHGGVVARGSTADVRDPHAHAFHRETQVCREFQAGFGIVNVAMDRAQWLPFFKFIRHGGVADVARMPDLVAGREVVLQARVQPAMCVA